MANTYEFYKPNLHSEYPTVDGPLSVSTYIAAMDAAYSAFRSKVATATKSFNPSAISNTEAGNKVDEKSVFSLADVDYPVYHSPYGKQVQKGHARLLFMDYLSAPHKPEFANIEPSFLDLPYPQTINSKEIEKSFMALSKADYASRVSLSMRCASRCGNMYTASLYGGLASLLSTVDAETLKGKRISMYAFGGGCASTFWTMRVKGDVSEIAKKMDLLKRLESMEVVSSEEYTEGLQVCFSTHSLPTPHFLFSTVYLYMFAELIHFGFVLWWYYSSGKITITWRHTSPRETSRTSGREHFSSTASIACSGGNTSRLER